MGGDMMGGAGGGGKGKGNVPRDMSPAATRMYMMGSPDAMVNQNLQDIQQLRSSGFDPYYYAQNNPDVVGQGYSSQPGSPVKYLGDTPWGQGLYDHYTQYGRGEGRLASDPTGKWWGPDNGSGDPQTLGDALSQQYGYPTVAGYNTPKNAININRY